MSDEPEVHEEDPREAARVGYERSLIAAAMSGIMTDDAFDGLEPADFTGPREAFAKAIVKAQAQGPIVMDGPGLIALSESTGPQVWIEASECATAPFAPANIPAYARVIRQASTERRVRAIAADLLNGSAPDPAPALEKLRALVDRAAGSGFDRGSVSLLEYLSLPSQRPPSIMGDGLLARGDLAMLYGKGGLGKSYLCMQLMIAAARCQSWMGLAPAERPIRSGYVAMELTRYYLQERFRRLLGSFSGCEDNIFPRGMDDLGFRPNLMEPQTVAELITWVRKKNLDMLVLDAMSRFHDGDETEDAPHVMAAADRIRIQSGALVVFIHHDRKSQEGEDDLDALRGSTRFRDDPNTLIRVVRNKQGMVEMRFPKANHAQMPKPIFLRELPGGLGFEPTDSPETRGDKTRERILQVIAENPTGISRHRIEEITGYARATVARHIKQLDLVNVGTASGPIYRLASHAVSENSETLDNDQGF